MPFWFYQLIYRFSLSNVVYLGQIGGPAELGLFGKVLYSVSILFNKEFQRLEAVSKEA